LTTTRRDILKAGVGASALFLPGPFARVWAQSEGTVKLLRLPKIALVVGNGKYKIGPLKNPANDAAAISEALKAAGFAVTARLDASRAELAAAIDAYVRELAAKKCVGLFYYAGHGMQLAWKNYMLPVEADIDSVADVQKQAVEVNALMEGLAKAGNPMNVIILDACRDNPFGNLKGADHKGLSQMDAPSHTILAYATSPGNVASDGEGANGLYTENLLREMKVPEAKIEDVFKRVRLGVRRRSNGAQIPWESTSLEEDFWFVPPKEMKKLSDAERDHAYQQELTLWERIQKSAEPGPLEDYLRRYPNGDFAELAQLHLDRVLARLGEQKIRIASAEGNPYTKGSATANVAYRIGDRYTFRSLDPYSKVVQQTWDSQIMRISDDEVLFSDGRATDLLGNNRAHRDGRKFSPNQSMPLEFTVGKRWGTRFTVTMPGGSTFGTEMEMRIATREKVTLPAGTFDAFLVEARGISHTPRGTVRLEVQAWRAPEVQVPVSREEFRRIAGRVVFAERIELAAYQQA
jgi:uncharacterized caspase-like protein